MNNENNGLNTTSNSNETLLNSNPEKLEFIEEEVESLNEFTTDNQNIETLENNQNAYSAPVTDLNNANDITPINNQSVMNNNVVKDNKTLVNEIPKNSNGVIAPSIPVDSTKIGFVASSAPLKKKKNPWIGVSIVLIVLIILGSVGYFVIYPLVVKNILNDPKKLFDTAISQVSSELINFVDENIHDKQILDLEFEIETDIESLKDFSGYTYSGRLGIDADSKLLEMGYGIGDEYKNKYNQYYYIKNGEHYTRYSTYRNLIRYGNLENEQTTKLFNNLTSLFADSKRFNNEDLKYLINKTSDLLKNSIDTNNLSKEDASITINNQALKVIRNKYTLNKDKLISTKKYIVDELTNDTRVIEILTKVLGVTEDEVKTLLNGNYTYNFKNEKYELNLDNTLESLPDDYVLSFSIFTYGNNISVVGYEISDNKNNNLHYYNKDGNFEIGANYNNDLITNSLKILGIKDKDKVNVTGTYNDQDVFTLSISALEKNKIVLDYSITNNNEVISGAINYNRILNQKNYNVSLTFALNFNDYKTNINLKLNNDWTSEVANVNVKIAKDLTFEEFNNIETTFKNYISKTPLNSLFETISGDRDHDINDYYDGNSDNNNNNNDNNSDDNNDSNNNDDVINNNTSNSIIEKAQNMKMCELAICPSDCTSGYCICTYYNDDYSQNVTCYKR